MGQWDFTLKVEFSFLCFFVERDKEVIILLRELRKPGKAVPPRPVDPHYPVVRYSRALRRDPPGSTSKKTFAPPQGMVLGGGLDLVAFEQEDLEIRPAGRELKAKKLKMVLDEVFSTSKLADAMPDSDQNASALKVREELAQSGALDSLLAGRIRIGEGNLFVDRASGAVPETPFGLYPLMADYTKCENCFQENGFELTRMVTWELEVPAENEADAFVDFRFKKSGTYSVLRLYPDPESKTVEVTIRNCEESEIFKPDLPVGYEDNIHRGELMSCYPMLQGFGPSSILPIVKLAPYGHNGSGICAPFRST